MFSYENVLDLWYAAKCQFVSLNNALGLQYSFMDDEEACTIIIFVMFIEFKDMEEAPQMLQRQRIARDFTSIDRRHVMTI